MGVVNNCADIFERHKQNFEFIFNQNSCAVPNDAQAILMFLWAFFVNSKEGFNYIDSSSVKIRDVYISVDGGNLNITTKSGVYMIKFLRNALSHGNFIFHRDQENRYISSITLFNSYKAPNGPQLLEVCNFTNIEIFEMCQDLCVTEASREISCISIFNDKNVKNGNRLFEFLGKIDRENGYTPFNK